MKRKSILLPEATYRRLLLYKLKLSNEKGKSLSFKETIDELIDIAEKLR